MKNNKRDFYESENFPATLWKGQTIQNKGNEWFHYKYNWVDDYKPK